MSVTENAVCNCEIKPILTYLLIIGYAVYTCNYEYKFEVRVVPIKRPYEQSGRLLEQSIIIDIDRKLNNNNTNMT